MRTTVSLDDDVAAAVQRLRNEKNMGLSEAVNELVRAGLAVPTQRKRFVQRAFPMGARIDVTNVGDALELLEEQDHH
ncbi:MAG: ribbon-helix-helix protein, CopG family [Actinobacteria bacterium]|nr:ribbon-helix-helix protein, CopG family [Actinomycetota bacterium]